MINFANVKCGQLLFSHVQAVKSRKEKAGSAMNAGDVFPQPDGDQSQIEALTPAPLNSFEETAVSD